MTDDEPRAQGMMAGGLMNRWADPIEIAYPILWLASDEASLIACRKLTYTSEPISRLFRHARALMRFAPKAGHP